MSDVKNPADALEREEDASIDGETTPEMADEVEHVPAGEDAQPDLPEGTNLMTALIDAQREAKSNQDGWQRARAEFANYKRRVERERGEAFQRGALDTLSELLPIIDDFDRAFESAPAALSEDPWLGGVSMIQRNFLNMLEKYAVEAIDPTGEVFDPTLHQAIGSEDSDEVESGHVIETLQKGYRAADHILRPALVKVAT